MFGVGPLTPSWMIKKIYKNNNIIIFLISQEGVRVQTPNIKFYLYQQNNKILL
jgi:hypothetical protein